MDVYAYVCMDVYACLCVCVVYMCVLYVFGDSCVTLASHPVLFQFLAWQN